MSDRAHEVEEDVREFAAFTRRELASNMHEDRGKLIEALIFMAGQMGHTEDYAEYGPHVAALANVAEALAWGANELDRHDERQAFARRALEGEASA